MKNQEEKFFFNLNVFDEDEEEEIEDQEDLPPPPPTFSEAELEKAKKQAFEQGKQQGLQESRESREQKISETLEKIAHSVGPLVQAEIHREKIYEKEAVNTTLRIFEKLFPLFHEELGFEDLKNHLSEILKKQAGHKKILILVHPDAVTGIEQHVSDLKYSGMDIQITVKGDESLGHGACRLNWDDGGAVRDIDSVAQEIRAIMQHVLAGGGSKRHDSEEDVMNAEDSNPGHDVDEDKSDELETPESDVMEKPDE